MRTQWFYYTPDPEDDGGVSPDDGSAGNASDNSGESSDEGFSDAGAGDGGDPGSADDTSSSGEPDTGDGSTTGDTTSGTTDAPGDPSNSDEGTSGTPDSEPVSGGSPTSDNMSASNDFETDMQTIRDYVRAVVETKNKMATAYLSAIDNFQTTVQSASPTEAKPDILTVVLKTGLKTIEKIAVTAVKEATQADLGPLVDMVHAIYDEVERANKAAQSLEVGEWIKNARTAITNAYTQDQSGEGLRNQLESEYKNNDEGGRGGYIAGIQNELAAVNSIQVPKAEVIEVAFYTSWINQHFNNDCIDGTGIIYLQFDDDGTVKSASVNAPQGDKIAGALNNVMSRAGVSGLMNLDVVKKACKGDACMCFEGNNVVRKAASDDSVQAFLTSPDSWKLLTRFS